MKSDAHETDGFTLIELLVVLAVLGILAAMLFPALSATVGKGRRTICLSNLKQINQGVILYAADNSDLLFPFQKGSRDFNYQEWTSYVRPVGTYVGRTGAPSSDARIFACPADRFYQSVGAGRLTSVNEALYSRPEANYLSYFFNAANAVFQFDRKFPGQLPGVLGQALGSIRTPTRTVLVEEAPALDSYSWHQPRREEEHFNNALDMLGFADGHVSYVELYAGSNNPSGHFAFALSYDPPPEYNYQWSGN